VRESITLPKHEVQQPSLGAFSFADAFSLLQMRSTRLRCLQEVQREKAVKFRKVLPSNSLKNASQRANLMQPGCGALNVGVISM
jgi:hypothetical protein